MDSYAYDYGGYAAADASATATTVGVGAAAAACCFQIVFVALVVVGERFEDGRVDRLEEGNGNLSKGAPH